MIDGQTARLYHLICKFSPRYLLCESFSNHPELPGIHGYKTTHFGKPSLKGKLKRSPEDMK